MPNALITGGSRGLGRALARALLKRGWHVVVDGRDDAALRDAAGELVANASHGLVTGANAGALHAIPGDVADASHRAALVRAAAVSGRLDLLVNNASRLGPSPLPALTDLDPAAFERILTTNVVAPLALVRLAAAALEAAGGAIVNVSSDAAVGAYEGWGGYGASKAALDHLSAVLAVERPRLRVYALDPGDMRTAMHQRAFPGQDISDRPPPEERVPALLRLIDERPPSGRYVAEDLLVTAAVPGGRA